MKVRHEGILHQAGYFSQKLFDLTQIEAKGLSQELNLNFEFLLPSLRTMEQFGIRHVEGRQDIELAKRLRLPVIDD